MATSLTKQHYDITKKLAKATGRSMSDVLREALLIHLGRLSYLPDEEKKALGLNNGKGGDKS